MAVKPMGPSTILMGPVEKETDKNGSGQVFGFKGSTPQFVG
eukprot:contig_12592_g3016